MSSADAVSGAAAAAGVAGDAAPPGGDAGTAPPLGGFWSPPHAAQARTSAIAALVRATNVRSCVIRRVRGSFRGWNHRQLHRRRRVVLEDDALVGCGLHAGGT